MNGEVLSGAEFAALRNLIGLGVPAAAAAALGVTTNTLRDLDRGRFTGPQAAATCRDLLDLAEQHDRRVDEAIELARSGKPILVSRGDAVGLAVATRVLGVEPDARIEWAK